jgi:hypothetical protein
MYSLTSVTGSHDLLAELGKLALDCRASIGATISILSWRRFVTIFRKAPKLSKCARR